MDKLGITYNSDNSICVNVYFDDIDKKNLIVDKLKDKNIYVKNYSKKSFNGKYVNFITVSIPPREFQNAKIDAIAPRNSSRALVPSSSGSLQFAYGGS